MLDPGKGTQAGNAVVGRATERATIDGLLAAARLAESGALVVAGPPGIGKSMLVQYAMVDEEIKRDVGEFDSAVREAAEAGRTWWNEVRESMRRPLDEVRARIEKRQSEHELNRAQRQAEAAEEDAADAVAAAEYFLNVAEYSVVDAALARMAADDLAAAKSSGATS